MKLWTKTTTWTMCCTLILGLSLVASPPGQAAVLPATGQTTGAPASRVHHCPDPVDHECKVTLAPNPIEELTGPSADCITAFNRDFPNWSVTYNWTQPWNGNLNIDKYEARDYSDGIPTHPGCLVTEYTWPDGSKDVIGGMGAHLEATYTPHVHDPTEPLDPPTDDITRFRWVQIIITDDPASGATSPYVDPCPNDDTLPFYWKEGEHGDYNFVDWPARDCPCLGHKFWRAELYLTDWYNVPGDPNDRNLIIYEGIRWGFDIDCVPEPVTVVYLLFGTLLLLRWRGAGC